MNIDPSGHDFWSVLGDIGRFVGGLAITVIGVVVTYITAPLALIPGLASITQASYSLMMYGGFIMASSWDKQIKSDMDLIKWNPFNSNETAVLGSSKISFYKGIQ